MNETRPELRGGHACCQTEQVVKAGRESALISGKCLFVVVELMMN